jgi:hypothetical protein
MLIISKNCPHITKENFEDFVKNHCAVESVIDLTLLKNYKKGMILKDKRNSRFVIRFVGNFDINIVNIKTNKEKQVPLTRIVEAYEIIK